ncbi:MAG: type I restriction enzyme HsdR N-terminal domain-containing protein [Bacteroidota bacterium]
MMVPLNLPTAELSLKRQNDQVFVLCQIRRKWLQLTPEEWVRQHLLVYLITHKNILKGRIAVEMTVTYNGMQKRCDIVVLDAEARPLAIVECKAPEIPLGTAVFEQIAQYNRALNVEYLILSNGMEHIISRIDRENGQLEFLQDLPNL